MHGPQKGLDLLETLDGAGGLEGHHRLDYLNTQAARSPPPISQSRRRNVPAKSAEAPKANVRDVLAQLERLGTQKTIDGMARYGIEARQAFGVPMGALLGLSKKLGRDHDLSLALWESGWYEARLLASLVGDPARVTRRQMNAWAASFENWGDCDTVCFKLFDQSPFAWEKARQWSASPRELVKRGGFVLMACLAGHDKTAPDRPFLEFLPLIEEGARDERNLVKKGVSWALRGIGRRSPGLHQEALALAQKLARQEEAPCRWIGKDAVRELSSSMVRTQVARRAQKTKGRA